MMRGPTSATESASVRLPVREAGARRLFTDMLAHAAAPLIGRCSLCLALIGADDAELSLAVGYSGSHFRQNDSSSSAFKLGPLLHIRRVVAPFRTPKGRLTLCP